MNFPKIEKSSLNRSDFLGSFFRFFGRGRGTFWGGFGLFHTRFGLKFKYLKLLKKNYSIFRNSKYTVSLKINHLNFFQKIKRPLKKFSEFFKIPPLPVRICYRSTVPEAPLPCSSSACDSLDHSARTI